jgi:predicted metal-dependent HD superfamily phosphohydrolase
MADESMNRDRWVALCERLGCGAGRDHFAALVAAYAERHRKYHDARHVSECLALFDSLRGLCEFPDEVELAIWVHDAVYLPRRSDNEEKSADLAVVWLSGCGTDRATVERVRSLVLATRHASEPRTRDEEILVDIDRHILGASPARFDEYEAQVRREYWWVPSTMFRRKRAQILRGFLAREPLYNTSECRARFEESARSNLRRSLASLTG